MAQKTEKEETEFHVPETITSSCIPTTTTTVTAPPPPPPTASAPPDPPQTTTTTPPPPKRASAVESERSESSSSEKSRSEMKMGAEEEGRRGVRSCRGCKRKMGLTSGFRCRCGDLFCWEHRYSDRHDCSFDYKAAGRDAIARDNPVVKAPKILKV